MNKSNLLLWLLIILFVGFAFWAISTGKLNLVAGLFIDGFWKPLEGMVRSIFRK